MIREETKQVRSLIENARPTMMFAVAIVLFLTYMMYVYLVRRNKVPITESSSERKAIKPSGKKQHKKKKRKGKRKHTRRPTNNPLNSKYNDPHASKLIHRLQTAFSYAEHTTENESTTEEKSIEEFQYIGMDCEMVGYGRNGNMSMLARCSLVIFADETYKESTDGFPKLKVVYDVYVKPTRNVTDYRTKYSGILPEHLNSEHAVSFEVCQSTVKRILRSNEQKKVILVGHALENDFEVLKYWHPRELTRDTAFYRPFMKPVRKKMRSKKLRHLVEEHLGIGIQNNSENDIDIDHGNHASSHGEHSEGHSSVEDASATLLLYNKFSVVWEHDLKKKAMKRG